MPLELLSAADIAQVVSVYTDALREHRAALNRLNVYPVPDGDTGTNMGLTLEAVQAELVDAGGPGGADLQAVAKCLSHGSLMGARGNSGVILSQILRGVAEALGAAASAAAARSEEPLVGPTELAEAFSRAADGAYAAVSNPVEGTILTVARAAASAAEAALRDGTPSLDELLSKARDAAASALAGTTEQLAVLRAAGVVDAGGAGLLLLLDSFLQVVAGRPIQPPPAPEGAAGKSGGVRGREAAVMGTATSGAMPARASGARPDRAPTATPEGPPGPAHARATGPAHARATGPAHARATGPAHEGPPGAGPEGPEGDVGDLRYEVMFFLDAPDDAVPTFRKVWEGYGGSIVIVGGDGIYNCHIHTDDIGGAIEAAIEIGRPSRIRVTDLAEQVEEERWVRQAETAGAVQEPEPAEPVNCAAVAVCTGEGVKRIFLSLGASQLVAGGQSANPSTAEVLAAISAAPADQVVVLPNNPNVVAVAEQAAAHSGKKVRVVPTSGVAQGFAALLAYDPEADVDTNADAMAASLAHVTSGEVVQASRDAVTEVGQVREGDWLGISGHSVRAVAPAPASAAGAAIALLGKLVRDGEHEIVTLIEGEGSTPAQTREVLEWLSEHHPSISTEVHHGGQPLYPYLLSIE